MTGAEYIRNAYLLKENDRPAWLPFVGCHGAFLTGVSAQNYLSSSELIVKGLEEAIRRYTPDGLPVTFDLQMEAEALGCRLLYSPSNPPAVVSHPLEEGVKLEELPDFISILAKREGRTGEALSAARTISSLHPEVAFFGLVTGPLTLALHLMGTSLFTEMFENPEKVESVIEYCTGIAAAMSGAYIEAGCSVIAVVDPMTSQIDPVTFETFVLNSSKKLFSKIREMNSLSSFFVCGQAEHNLELMAACGPDNISVDENIPLTEVKRVAGAAGISFGGNLKLTTTLLLGTEEECERDALECIDTGGNRGFVLAPGCDLPMNVPVKNVEAVSRIVKDRYRQDILRNTSMEVSQDEVPDISSRWCMGKAVVDVVTLDSASCAPCSYMMELVSRLLPAFGDKVEIHEHKIKTYEGLAMMKALGVTKIPTICINGEPLFISQTPPLSKLTEAVKERI
ncbi:MAG: uroporphyrinogen decarboxylase [Bacteroidetes bacterium HGW-Bacteroidetes-10]|nr:MAG: uroporphyrinogen decarboxylase [Bacteroidetes bacterium HGW-Bacteroidetes-10]